MELAYRNNQYSLFRKYAGLVTWFSNLQLGKDYLGIKTDRKIDLLLPNGHRKIVDQGKRKIIYVSRFHTRPVYSSKLSPALQQIDRISHWINNFEEAQMVLLGQLGLLSWGKTPAIARAFHFDVSTFNPDVDPESTSVDGTAERSTPGGESFASLIGGAGSVGGDTGSTDNMPFFISHSSTDNYTENKVGFFLYDTSSIPDGNEVIEATNQIFTGGTSINELSQSVSLGKCTPASNTAIVAADYSQRVKTRQASDLSFPAASSSYTFILNGVGLASIEKTGITKFSVMISSDMDSAAPTWIASKIVQLTTNFSDAGSNKPTLTVTHEATVGGMFFVN